MSKLRIIQATRNEEHTYAGEGEYASLSPQEHLEASLDNILLEGIICALSFTI